MIRKRKVFLARYFLASKYKKKGGDKMRCNTCNNDVNPQKKFNWLAFILLAGIFYIPIYLLKSKKCPVCGAKI